jgi:hypothetical protein
VGGFDPAFDGTEDLDFALKVAQRYPVAVFPDCLTRYYLHDGQTGRRRLAGGNAKVLRHHLQRETDCRDARPHAREARALPRLVGQARRVARRAAAPAARGGRVDPACASRGVVRQRFAC